MHNFWRKVVAKSTPAEQKDWIDYVRNSSRVLEAIAKFCDEKEKAKDAALENEFNEGWAYRCAYTVGYNKALKDIRNLVDLNNQKGE